MPRVERIREFVKGATTADYFAQKQQAGWRLVAAEWEREAAGGGPPANYGRLEAEIPYGLRVAPDCRTLEEDPIEKEALLLMMDCIVRDLGISTMADELNRKGFRTRQGATWGAIAVFEMLPRLIEVGPSIFPTHDWAERRRHLVRLFSGPGTAAEA